MALLPIAIRSLLEKSFNLWPAAEGGGGGFRNIKSPFMGIAAFVMSPRAPPAYGALRPGLVPDLPLPFVYFLWQQSVVLDALCIPIVTCLREGLYRGFGVAKGGRAREEIFTPGESKSNKAGAPFHFSFSFF